MKGRTGRSRWLWRALLAVLLFVVAGVAAPFIRVDHQRERIRGALERAL
jgi:uncharacterized membrane protein YhaH (DUF805 family)